jgi:hypothetical protein
MKIVFRRAWLERRGLISTKRALRTRYWQIFGLNGPDPEGDKPAAGKAGREHNAVSIPPPWYSTKMRLLSASKREPRLKRY